MKLTRKLAALAMAVLLAVSLTACPPKQVAQDMVVHLVHKLGLVEESDEDDTDTTTKAPAGGSVEFPAEMDTTAARVVTYPVENTLYISFNGIANRSTEYFVAGGDSMTVTGYATTEASNEKYMYFKIAFWELSDDQDDDQLRAGLDDLLLRRRCRLPVQRDRPDRGQAVQNHDQL